MPVPGDQLNFFPPLKYRMYNTSGMWDHWMAKSRYLHQHRVHELSRGDGVQVLLQVHGQELEDEVETRLLHQDIQQSGRKHQVSMQHRG